MAHHISILKPADLLTLAHKLDGEDIKLIHFRSDSINLRQIEQSAYIVYVDPSLICHVLKDNGTVPERIKKDVIQCMLNATPKEVRSIN